MNCPKCGKIVKGQRNRCEFCGKDLTIYRRTSRLSNSYYNRGLEKAKVRDLTGAVIMLKKSLEIDKRNTNARNLLGLVFFEMGETVAALSEWVISKHFQAENNYADHYMNLISENPTKLDSLNQAVKKYNIAVASAKEGNDDLAILQLKKVISLNPHFIRALLLLALLYMRNNEYERARRFIQRALKIDLTNTTALRYRSEMNKNVSQNSAKQISFQSESSSGQDDINRPISPISSYREEKPNIWLFVNLILGVIIGIATVFFLIVPTVKQSAAQEAKEETRQYGSQISSLTAKLTSAEKESDSLKDKLEKKEKELEQALKPDYDKTMYQDFLKALSLYLTNVSQPQLDDDVKTEIVKLLAKVDSKGLNSEDGATIYEKLKEELFPQVAVKIKEEGIDAVEAEEFQDAVTNLLLADEYAPNDPETIYNLGRAYQGLGEVENAKKYYNRILTEFPKSDFVTEVNYRMEEF